MDVSRLPRKSAKDMCMAPVPQTDTRGHVKSTKALERFTAKELGKITPWQNNPVTSGKGVLSERWEPQRNGSGDCLTKTQGYAKSKDEIYGLTPARCWKVKRRCQPQGEALN